MTAFHHHPPAFPNNEIAHFDALAERFWAQDGPFAMLHRLNAVRLEFILSHHALSETRVLDIGCGGGILAEAMAREGARVTGIDRSSKGIEVARAHAATQQLTINYEHIDCTALVAQQPPLFSVITCMEVLEHVDDPASLICSARDLLAQEGVLIVSAIDRTPLAWLKMIGMAEHVLGWVPVGTHHYTKFIRPSELDRACRQAGLTCTARMGLGFHPLKKTFFLTSSPGTHYLAAYRPNQANRSSRSVITPRGK